MLGEIFGGEAAPIDGGRERICYRRGTELDILDAFNQCGIAGLVGGDLGEVNHDGGVVEELWWRWSCGGGEVAVMFGRVRLRLRRRLVILQLMKTFESRGEQKKCRRQREAERERERESGSAETWERRALI
jgi:hypothetical protein